MTLAGPFYFVLMEDIPYSFLGEGSKETFTSKSLLCDTVFKNGDWNFPYLLSRAQSSVLAEAGTEYKAKSLNLNWICKGSFTVFFERFIAK